MKTMGNDFDRFLWCIGFACVSIAVLWVCWAVVTAIPLLQLAVFVFSAIVLLALLPLFLAVVWSAASFEGFVQLIKWIAAPVELLVERVKRVP